MRLDKVVYGPHGGYGYYTFYYYNETSLQYGTVLNDSDDSIGFGFQFEKTDTVSGIGLYVVEYEGSPDYAMTFVTISGQLATATDPRPNVDATTKIAEHYSNAQWQDFKPTVVGSGWSWIDLVTPLNVTKGDIAALVIIPSGAIVPDTSNYVEINDESTFANTYPGSWTHSTSWIHYNWEPPAALKYSDNTIQGLSLVGLPYAEFASPAEWGVEFILPIGATCIGAAFNFSSYSSSDAPFKVILADSSDGELASITIPDHDLVENSVNYNSYLGWDTAIDPVLDPSVAYRIYLKPTSAEVIDKKGFILENEASKSVLPGGTDWKWIERSTPASGWTYKTDHYPWISAILIDLVGGTGGGDGGGQGNSSYGFIG